MGAGAVQIGAGYGDPDTVSGSARAYSAVRWICFLVLLTSTVLSLSARFPQSADFSRLLYDVQHGNTSVVTVEGSGPTAATAVWRTGPFRWHKADVPYFTPRPAETALMPDVVTLNGDGVAITVEKPRATTARDQAADLIRQVAGAHHTVDVRDAEPHTAPGLRFTFSLADPALREPLSVVAGALWLALFIGMLFTRDHTYANRWAWFWLFGIGGAGPMLMLWMEPRPLWRPARRRRPAAGEDARPLSPMTGGVGFFHAVLWTTGLTIVAWLMGYVSGEV